MTEISLATAGAGRLKLLCVGAGRDGTTSIAHMLQMAFDQGEPGGRAEHEYQSADFADRFCAYRETRDPYYLAELRGMVANCPFECLVGNGYAAVLPQFVEHYGRGLSLIHIRRADRDACIRSIKKNCELFPETYGYYAADAAKPSKRPAAFHFGEMSRAEWDRLPLVDKIGWYYDKTHALIEDCRASVDTYVEIATEDINSDQTRRTLARLALGSEEFVPPATHLNPHFFDAAMLPGNCYKRAQWLLQWLDPVQLSTDEMYFLEYALQRSMDWSERLIRGEPGFEAKTPAQTAQLLDRAERILRSGLAEIGGRRAKLAEQHPGAALPSSRAPDATDKVRVGPWGPSPGHSAVTLNGSLDPVVGMFGGGGTDPNLYLSAATDGGTFFYSGNAEVAALRPVGAFEARELRIAGATVISRDGDLTAGGYYAAQSYTCEAPGDGFAVVMANNIQRLLLDPPTALAAGTIVMPPAPADGQLVKILSTRQIRSLQVAANAGQTVKGGALALARDGAAAWIYRAANATWYRDQ